MTDAPDNTTTQDAEYAGAGSSCASALCHGADYGQNTHPLQGEARGDSSTSRRTGWDGLLLRALVIVGNVLLAAWIFGVAGLYFARTAFDYYYLPPANVDTLFEGWGDEDEFGQTCRTHLSSSALSRWEAIGPVALGLYRLQLTVDAAD